LYGLATIGLNACDQPNGQKIKNNNQPKAKYQQTSPPSPRWIMSSTKLTIRTKNGDHDAAIWVADKK